MSGLTGVLLTGCLSVLGACVQPHPTGQTVIAAKQACEVPALAEERASFVRIVDRLAVDSEPAPGFRADNNHTPVGHYDKSEKTSSYSAETGGTILDKKLSQYRAEIEASFRFAMAQCVNYNVCMTENRFDERLCADSRMAWQSSQERFDDLSVELATLEKQPRKGAGQGTAASRCTGLECGDKPRDCDSAGHQSLGGFSASAGSGLGCP